ncbi:hypothetical protein N3K66_006140 [Trichothecium roseum]|uniref:Uncharacterized protein n=1 Tax=Trichothecium roseum TaxID=47278 RepID=A0ACC0UZT6_9HYPO|nr:hypothetical protein N3K66_006140 [Trichothecium roseum]
MPSLVVGALLGIACLYALLRSVLRLTQDAREPPSVEDGIPFLGPVISMLTQKSQLYPNLKKKYNLGIYTLRFPAARLYIVNATALLPALQKNWRLISFTPIIAHSGTTAMGVSREGGEAMSRDMTSDGNPVVASMPIIARALGPGPELDRMNARAVEVIVAGMEKLRAKGVASSSPSATRLQFWSWAHHEIFMATTEAVYGPLNPYRNKSVEDAWNIFGPNYLNLALSPFKTITARKAYNAREYLVSAWRDYILAGGPGQGSAFVGALHEHNAAHGFSLDDLSRFHVGQSFAVISSTGPAAWWLMYHIFSDPQVLSDVRGELSSLVQDTTAGDDNDNEKADKDDESCSYAIDLAAMQDACPILVSTFKETMRHHSIGSAVRVCLEDTFLDDNEDDSHQNRRVLLKKGSLVIAPQPVHHADPPTWGPDAHAFDHLRFVRRPGRPRPDPVAFRAFGGGRHLCPGRHFSAREVMAQAALMVLMFDVAPVGGGPWPEPTCEKTPMLSPFQIPDEDVEVDVTPRDTRRWNVKFSESKQSTNIVSEDMKAE